MNKQLSAAVNRYKGEDDVLIHPISELDAQITTEIIELFKKMQFTAAVDILNRYKAEKDEDIAVDLLELNTNIGKQKSVTEPTPTPEFVRYMNLNGKRIDLFLLISFEELDFWEGENVTHCILLNPTPPECKSIPFYANDLIRFENLAVRDLVAVKLDSYFELCRGKFLK